MPVPHLDGGSAIASFWASVPTGVKEYYWAARTLYTEWWLWGSVVFVLVLEAVIPAVRRQKLLSRALLEDFVWLNLQTLFAVAALPAYVGILQQVYSWVTGGHGVIAVMAAWPIWIKVAVSLLAADFLTYVHHRVRHTGIFWHFHAIHHSQRELNQFTDLRLHFVDILVAYTVLTIPMFALRIAPAEILAVGFLMAAYSRFEHSNVRATFGPLGYVFVSPQFHRIHHSIEVRHQDRNFGNIFSIWDRLFGTLYAATDEYPETGVVGMDFSTTGPVRAIAQQLVDPFRRIRNGWNATADRAPREDRPPTD
jgi:sterol desaturase/sphingolipid hydroxylase (fatty acid hydroxylase superfamily)